MNLEKKNKILDLCDYQMIYYLSPPPKKKKNRYFSKIKIINLT